MSWCVITECESNKPKTKEKVSFFQVPKNVWENKTLLAEWEKLIPIISKKKRSNIRVCARHFEDADIVKEWSRSDAQGTIVISVSNNDFNFYDALFTAFTCLI